MTTTTVRPSAAPDAPLTPTAPPGPPEGARKRSWLFPPGWPLAWLFVGYPLWWILGIAEITTFTLSIIMGLIVLRRRTILLPRSFGFWLIFLVWCLGGLFLLQVNAPGAVQGPSGGRYAVWAFRTMWYVSATLILLYVGNHRREISLDRIARYMSWMFVTIVVGGVLGALAPRLDFPSVIELVLPHSITNIPFVQQMVHPNVAQVQRVLGYQEARPSAPFSYTNTWGLALACFLPFFVVSWVRRDAGWRRFAAPLILVASILPIVQSLNRGLWGALIGMAAFVTVRYAFMGRTRTFLVLVLAFTAVAGVVVTTPLATTVSERFAHQHSNAGRTDLGRLTIRSTIAGSPISGYGTTRPVQGNFNSIAGGSTAECPKCSPPSLGTQGQAWLLVFTAGFGGLLAYAGFFALQLFRGLRLRSRYATTGLAVLVAHLITSVVYNVNGPGLLAIMIGVAFLWRESMDLDPALVGTASGKGVRSSWPTAGGYVTLVRRNLALLLVAVLAGAAGGVFALDQVGRSVSATVSVSLGNEPAFVPGRSPLTIDSDAQYVRAPSVVAAVAKATKRATKPRELLVTATPNSRILQITYAAKNGKVATAGAEAAANAFLAARSARLSAERSVVAAGLQGQVNTARDALVRSQAILAQLRISGSAPASRGIRILNNDIDHQIGDLGRLSVQVERATSQSITPGEVVAGPVVRQDKGKLRVYVVSGILVALVLGFLVALWRDRRSPVLRNRKRVTRETGLPVLAIVPPGMSGPRTDVRAVAQAVAARGALACVAAGRSTSVHELSAVVDRSISHQDNALGQLSRAQTIARPGVVIAADRKTRAREVLAVRDIAERTGSAVLGVIFVDDRVSIPQAAATNGLRPVAPARTLDAQQ